MRGPEIGRASAGGGATARSVPLLLLAALPSLASCDRRIGLPHEPWQVALLAAFAVALGALGLLGVLSVSLRFFAARAGHDPLRAPPSPVGEAARVLAVVACAFVYFGFRFHHAPMDVDVVRDFQYAEDCIDSPSLCSLGVTATIGVLRQGSIWVRFLALCHSLGLGLRGIELVVAALDALSLAVFYALGRRFIAPRLALLSTSFCALGLQYTVSYPMLFHTSPGLVQAAATFYFLAAGAATGGTLAFVAAGACAMVSADTHMMFLTMLPLGLLHVGACARRPYLAALLFSSVAAAIAALESGSTWHLNGRFIVESGLLAPVILGFLATFGVGLRLRPRFCASDEKARARALLCASTVGYVLAFCAAALVFPVFKLYVTAGVPGLAFAAAALVDGAAGGMVRVLSFSAWARRSAAALRPTFAAALALLATYGNHRVQIRISEPSMWSMLDGEKVAPEVYRSIVGPNAGRSGQPGAQPDAARAERRYADLIGHLQVEYPQVLPALSAFEPPAPPSPSPPPTDDLLLLRVPSASLPSPRPASWTVVDLGDGWAAVLRPIHSFLDRARARVCLASPATGKSDCLDLDLASDDARAEIGRRSRSRRAYFAVQQAMEKLGALGPKSPPLEVKVSVDVRPGTSGAAHRLRLLGLRLPWRIESVEGARSRGALPGNSVTIEPAAAPGKITFAASWDGSFALVEALTIPIVAELTDGEAELAALLDRAP